MIWNDKYSSIDKEERAKVLIDSISYTDRSSMYNPMPTVTLNFTDITNIYQILDMVNIHEKIKTTIINTFLDMAIVEFMANDIKNHDFMDIIHNNIPIVRLKLTCVHDVKSNTTINDKYAMTKGIQIDASKYMKDLDKLYKKIDNSVAICNIITYGSLFGLFIMYLFLSPM